MVIKWILDVEGCFLTCSYLEDWKVRCPQNLLFLGAMDWWILVIGPYTPEQRTASRWEQFSDMFRTRYVPLVERDRLAQEYLDLRQATETVTEIIKMFTKRALFCLEFENVEQGHMLRYLIMLNTDTRQFMSTQRYSTLDEFQDSTKRQDIKIETQTRERHQAPVQS